MRSRSGVLLATAVIATTALMRFHVAADLWGTILLLASVSVSLTFLTGLGGQLSLGHAALMGAGAYATGVLSVQAALPSALTVVIGAVVAGLVGLLFGLPAVRVRGQHLALVTIAGGFIFVRLISELEVAGAEAGIVDIPPVRLFGVELVPADHVWFAAATFVAIVVLSENLKRSRVGRSLAAIRDSEAIAEVSGIDSSRLKMSAFFFSALLAGLSGAIFANKEGFLAPAFFDLNLSLALVSACIVGGLRSPAGSGAAAILLLGPPVVVPMLSGKELLYTGPIALAVLFVAPEGLAGAVRRIRMVHGLNSLSRGVRAGAAASAKDALALNTRRPRISARGIEKAYGALQALAGVDVTIEPREIHGLIGPNGSGKTTLIDCITGLQKPDRGVTTAGDQDITNSSPHEIARLGVGRTFQTVRVLEALTVAETAALGLEALRPSRWLPSFLGVRDRGYRTRSEAALVMVGLDEVADQPATSLSYGQLRRLDLARAVAPGSGILILDEPTAGRNDDEVEELARFLTMLRDDGTGILLADHRIGFLMAVCDRVTLLDRGRVLVTGTPAEVSAAPEFRDAYLEAP